jgi:putative spermidine/putrescine transport system substrate-binding protein
MKMRLALALSVGLALTAALLPGPAEAGQFDGKTIRAQFWGGSDGLVIRKYIVAPFEKETGAKVVVEEGNTSASIAKVRAQKADPQLDVIFLDDIGVFTLAREGVLDKIELGKMPNAKDIHPTYVIGDQYGIGFFNYIMTLLYNDKLTKAPTSWEDLWKPEFKGKVLAPKITDTQALLFTVMAARLTGGSVDDLSSAWPKLTAFKPNIHSHIENRALGAEALQSGEALLAIEIPYYFKPYIDRGFPIAMTTDLKEGFFSITGSAALVKGGKGDREVAYALINRALSPEAQAGLAQELWYGPTNPKTKLDPAVAKFTVHTPEQYEKAIQVDRLKLLDKRQDIIQKWNEIMTK